MKCILLLHHPPNSANAIVPACMHATWPSATGTGALSHPLINITLHLHLQLMWCMVFLPTTSCTYTCGSCSAGDRGLSPALHGGVCCYNINNRHNSRIVLMTNHADSVTERIIECHKQFQFQQCTKVFQTFGAPTCQFITVELMTTINLP